MIELLNSLAAEIRHMINEKHDKNEAIIDGNVSDAFESNAGIK